MAEPLDRQRAFSGTGAVRPGQEIDVARLEAWLSAHMGGFAGAFARRPVQGRPVQPDLQAHRILGCVRPQAQAAGQAVAVGPCGRSRVPGDLGAPCAWLSRRPPASPVRGRGRHRHGLLRDGLRHRPGRLGALRAGRGRPGARRHLRCAERHHRHASLRSTRRRPVLPISARRKAMWRARSAAGPSSTAPRRRKRSPRWTG